jgi:hypothetical protein
MLRALTLGTALVAAALILPGAASAGQRDDGYRDRDRDYTMRDRDRDRDRDDRSSGWRHHGDHYDRGMHYGWEHGRHRGWDNDDNWNRRRHDRDDWNRRDRDHDRD